MAFPGIAFHPGCHKGLVPETAIIHYRNDLLTLSWDVDVWRQLAGERKGLVLCEEATALFSSSPLCLPCQYPKSENISTNENKNESKMINPPHLIGISSRSTQFACCFLSLFAACFGWIPPKWLCDGAGFARADLPLLPAGENVSVQFVQRTFPAQCVFQKCLFYLSPLTKCFPTSCRVSCRVILFSWMHPSFSMWECPGMTLEWGVRLWVRDLDSFGSKYHSVSCNQFVIQRHLGFWVSECCCQQMIVQAPRWFQLWMCQRQTNPLSFVWLRLLHF